MMEINFLRVFMHIEKAKTENLRPQRPLIALIALCLLSIGVSNSLHAGYLDELEAEAEVSTKDKLSQPKEESQRKKLETLLKNQQPGTYAFYKKLTPVNKVEVVKSYKESDKLTHIKKQIFDLYFAQEK
jgi:hypothetical protein